MTLTTPFLLAGLAATLGLTACSPSHTTTPAKEPAPALSRTASDGQIKATLTVTPGEADLTADNLLSLQVEAPAEIDIELPGIGARLTGLTAPNGSFDDPVLSADGTRLWRRHARLVPVVATEYRIAPLVIHYTDTSTNPAREGWFTTPPLVLALRSLSTTPAGRITTRLPYRWVRPPTRTILLGALTILLVACAITGLILLLRRHRRKATLARLTPRQRALAELETLLRANLIEKDRLKDFYVELTMVVRRYIERQHHVRAPEQTTEEFLQSVTQDPRFGPAVVERLRTFLEAADLVKFAAYHPEGADVEHAVNTARKYVESDADSASAVTEDE